MKGQSACIQYFLAFAAVLCGVASPVGAQALHVEQLRNGCHLVVVAQPLADATTVVWPEPAGAGAPQFITSGSLTLVADLESALGGDSGASPPVVVAVGGAQVNDLRRLLDRLFEGRPPSSSPPVGSGAVVEGRFERRLGKPGGVAAIRLELGLPSTDDPQRGEAEVLWDMLPALLEVELDGLRSRTDGDLGLLEASTNAEFADLAVRQLRVALAKVAESPRLDDSRVESATRRLAARRYARLERHPDSALRVLRLWIEGGAPAVQEFLFGIDGVTAATVRETARSWLPRHPGNTIVTLPPRTFNPRFASPPAVLQLDNGMTAAILERGSAPLATLCLRPVTVPDLDDETAAGVLSRVARELRDRDNPPALIAVERHPPLLELAVPPDAFADLGESLRAALEQVTVDSGELSSLGGSARRRSLRLMGGLLGVADGTPLSPASLLEPSNLALGAVAEDGEAAADALYKFWAFDQSDRVGASVRSVVATPRVREAAAGRTSVLTVAFELALAVREAGENVLASLLAERAATLLEDSEIEVLRPFVPGYRIVLLLVAAEVPMDTLEERLDDIWPELVRATTEDELQSVRRRVAAADAAQWSGATGRARRAAAVAAGAVGWRTAADLEMAALSVTPDEIDSLLGAAGDWRRLKNTGAGILPIVGADGRPLPAD
ncbi:MAG: hypothetical protein PVG92_06785 [Holophagae bacterium]|jgi:hypothetical protein